VPTQGRRSLDVDEKAPKRKSGNFQKSWIGKTEEKKAVKRGLRRGKEEWTFPKEGTTKG